MGQFILFLFIFIGTIVSYIYTSVFNDVLAYKESSKKDYAKAVAQDLTLWYKNNAFYIDSISGTVSPNFNLEYNGKILSSNRINCSNNVKAHIFVVVIPNLEGIQTTLNPDTGEIIKGKYDIVEVIDGCSIQKDLFLLTQKKVQGVANWLESYFITKTKTDIFGYRNYFASSSCGGWGDIPCVQNDSAQVLVNYLGGTQNDYKTAYGTDMIFDNSSSNVNVTTPPYTCRVGFITPWGDTNWIIATGQM